jgi:hypothetical protein
MSKNSLSTGNPVADKFMGSNISNELVGWALVSYLESKGLLDRDEFWDFLNIECKLSVHAIVKGSVDTSDDELQKE